MELHQGLNPHLGDLPGVLAQGVAYISWKLALSAAHLRGQS